MEFLVAIGQRLETATNDHLGEHRKRLRRRCRKHFECLARRVENQYMAGATIKDQGFDRLGKRAGRDIGLLDLAQIRKMFYKSSGRLQTAERRIVDDTQERLLHRLGRYRQRPYFLALRWIDSPRPHFGLPWVRLGKDEPARAKSAQQGPVRAVAGTDDQDRR